MIIEIFWYFFDNLIFLTTLISMFLFLSIIPTSPKSSCKGILVDLSGGFYPTYRVCKCCCCIAPEQKACILEWKTCEMHFTIPCRLPRLSAGAAARTNREKFVISIRNMSQSTSSHTVCWLMNCQPCALTHMSHSCSHTIFTAHTHTNAHTHTRHMSDFCRYTRAPLSSLTSQTAPVAHITQQSAAVLSPQHVLSWPHFRYTDIGKLYLTHF